MISSEFRKNDIYKGEPEGIAGTLKLAPYGQSIRIYGNSETALEHDVRPQLNHSRRGSPRCHLSETSGLNGQTVINAAEIERRVIGGVQ